MAATLDPIPHAKRWHDFLEGCRIAASTAAPLWPSGRLTRINGLVMEASGLKLPLGSTCHIHPGTGAPVEAEVVGFAGEKLYLMPSDEVFGLAPGARVVPFDAPCPSPQIEHPLDVGIRAINGMLTVGRGQRMGLFAGSGVGKSVLLGMMARYTEAEIIVVGLIGERGREVKEFIEQILGEDGRRRSVVVAAPADTGPLMRLQGAAYATTIAEYFRDQGKHVLLIMDSLTRYAMAQREIALAIGEPPATRGYPPSVFARLPQLVERTGNGPVGGGSITAFYTVLAEGDDQQDPIADSARAILDGHIVLNRNLADAGHYPAIDIEQSISRAMVSLITPEHLDHIRRFKVLFSRYQRSRDLIAVGAYVPGSDPVLDQAVAMYPVMEAFLQQKISEKSDFAASTEHLASLFS